jgi:citrate lyase subunit beta/citryl-CoA lyase
VKPYRSMLFVPGHKDSWAAKGVAAGADALILDLEDSVPEAIKAAARDTVAESIDDQHRRGTGPDIWVRPNSWDTGLSGDDLEAVVRPGLRGLFLPKIFTPTDVMRFDTLLEHFERRAGLAVGEVELLVTLETAQALAGCEALAVSSPRVASLVGTAVRDADSARAVGYEFTPEGLETLYLRSRVVLACRAAGLDHPICGLWQEVADLDGLVLFSEQNRRLGFRGQLVIHPSHVGPVNQVFSRSDEEIAFYRGMIAAFEKAREEGDGAVMYDGEHIDVAHVKTAEQIVALADGRNAR